MRELLDERLLHVAGEQAEVDLARGGHGVALGREIFQQRADTRVGVLDIVNRVLAVLAHGKTEIELHLRLGLGVEEVAAGVHRDLVEQIRQTDGLAGALRHADDLAVAHELHQLHQHDVQPVLAVEPQRVHRALQAGDVAVVVGAPDVDDLVEAADGEFVAVIGDVGGKVGVEPVRAAQHVVLQAELFDGLLALARLAQVRREDLGRLEPERAVLFIGIAEVGQSLHGIGHIPALMQAGLKEPLVVVDAVALKVALHLRDVAVKAEARERVVAGLLVAVEVLLALLLIKQLRQLADVVAVIAVLGEFDRILALDDLEVARLQTLGKLLDLVARVVDIELAPDICAGLL